MLTVRWINIRYIGIMSLPSRPQTDSGWTAQCRRHEMILIECSPLLEMFDS